MGKTKKEQPQEYTEIAVIFSERAMRAAEWFMGLHPLAQIELHERFRGSEKSLEKDRERKSRAEILRLLDSKRVKKVEDNE